MAEWWNKKYEFKLWSSLWLFLKEVEGLTTDALGNTWSSSWRVAMILLVDVLMLPPSKT